MDPLLSLDPDRLTVDPGGEARAIVTVRNPGELVEQYRLQVLGDSSRWTQLVPRDVSVLPGTAEGTSVQVVFRPPPAPAAPVGEIPFGIRCISMERQDSCAVVEGDILVSAVLDLQASIAPVGRTGRIRGRYVLTLTNTGTLPIGVHVSVVDDAELLSAAIAPVEVTVQPRQDESVYIAVRPRTAKVFGKPVDHPLTVGYDVPGSDRSGRLQTIYRQRPVLPKWLIVAAAVVLVVAAVIFAFVLFRPGADRGPQLVDGAPPGTSPPPTVTVLGPDSVQLDWVANPYATAYDLLVRQGTSQDAASVEAPKTSFVWTSLAGSGDTCFQVQPRNANGRGPATQPTCVQLQGGAAAASGEAASASAAASSAAAASADASASAAALSSAAAEAAASASASAASASAEASTVRPRRFWVTYYRTDKLLDVAAQVQATLQQAGVNAQLIDSKTLPPPLNASAQLWLVISDDYPTRNVALAECAARAAVPNVTCTANDPVA